MRRQYLNRIAGILYISLIILTLNIICATATAADAGKDGCCLSSSVGNCKYIDGGICTEEYFQGQYNFYQQTQCTVADIDLCKTAKTCIEKDGTCTTGKSKAECIQYGGEPSDTSKSQLDVCNP